MRIALSLLACLIGFYGLFGASTLPAVVAFATQERVEELAIYRYNALGEVSMLLEATEGILSTQHTTLLLQSPILRLLTHTGQLQVVANTAQAEDFRFPFGFSTLTLENELHLKLENQKDASPIAHIQANRGTWDMPQGVFSVHGDVKGHYQDYEIAAAHLSCTQSSDQKWEKVQAQQAHIQGKTDKTIAAQADRMSFSPDRHLVTLEGNAKLLRAQQEMVAEHLLFDLKSQTIRSAPGNTGKAKLIILQ